MRPKIVSYHVGKTHSINEGKVRKRRSFRITPGKPVEPTGTEVMTPTGGMTLTPEAHKEFRKKEFRRTISPTKEAEIERQAAFSGIKPQEEKGPYRKGRDTSLDVPEPVEVPRMQERGTYTASQQGSPPFSSVPETQGAMTTYKSREERIATAKEQSRAGYEPGGTNAASATWEFFYEPPQPTATYEAAYGGGSQWEEAPGPGTLFAGVKSAAYTAASPVLHPKETVEGVAQIPLVVASYKGPTLQEAGPQHLAMGAWGKFGEDPAVYAGATVGMYAGGSLIGRAYRAIRPVKPKYEVEYYHGTIKVEKDLAIKAGGPTATETETYTASYVTDTRPTIHPEPVKISRKQVTPEEYAKDLVEQGELGAFRTVPKSKLYGAGAHYIHAYRGAPDVIEIAPVSEFRRMLDAGEIELSRGSKVKMFFRGKDYAAEQIRQKVISHELIHWSHVKGAKIMNPKVLERQAYAHMNEQKWYLPKEVPIKEKMNLGMEAPEMKPEVTVKSEGMETFVVLRDKTFIRKSVEGGKVVIREVPVKEYMEVQDIRSLKKRPGSAKAFTTVQKGLKARTSTDEGINIRSWRIEKTKPEIPEIIDMQSFEVEKTATGTYEGAKVDMRIRGKLSYPVKTIEDDFKVTKMKGKPTGRNVIQELGESYEAKKPDIAQDFYKDLGTPKWSPEGIAERLKGSDFFGEPAVSTQPEPQPVTGMGSAVPVSVREILEPDMEFFPVPPGFRKPEQPHKSGFPVMRSNIERRKPETQMGELEKTYILRDIQQLQKTKVNTKERLRHRERASLKEMMNQKPAFLEAQAQPALEMQKQPQLIKQSERMAQKQATRSRGTYRPPPASFPKPAPMPPFMLPTESEESNTLENTLSRKLKYGYTPSFGGVIGLVKPVKTPGFWPKHGFGIRPMLMGKLPKNLKFSLKGGGKK